MTVENQQADLTTRDDEIDLVELALVVVSGWFKIAIVVCITTFGAIVYAVNQEPRYSASTIFELDLGKSQNLIPSQLAGLAALGGVSLGGGGSGTIHDRLQGRDFVERLAKDLDLAGDPFFYTPSEPPAPISLRGLLVYLGLSNAGKQQNKIEVIETVYRKVVEVDDTANGGIKVSVEHDDPKRAAEIANGIAARLISEINDENEQAQRARLAYLSDQLADALTQVDNMQERVASFALANSLGSPEDLARQSQIMSSARQELRRVEAMAVALDSLIALIETNPRPALEEYRLLRRTSPIVDEVEFRRLINVPEPLEAWVWPTSDRLKGVRSNIRDRKARILRSIAEMTDRAKRNAVASEQLESLKREAKVAEATYQVLIEQVKSRALSHGYKEDIERIYQTAIPPTGPISPNKKMIVVFGIVFGVFGGIFLVLVGNVRSRRIFSVATMRGIVSASLTITSSKLPRIRRRPIAEAFQLLSKKAHQSLSKITIAHNASDKRFLLLLSGAEKLDVEPLAFWMSRQFSRQGKTTAIVSLGGGLPDGLTFDDDEKIPALSVAAAGELTVYKPKTAGFEDLVLTSRELRQLLSTESTSSVDQVIVCAGHGQAENAALAFGDQQPYTIIAVQAGKSKKGSLEAISHQIQPDILVNFS